MRYPLPALLMLMLMLALAGCGIAGPTPSSRRSEQLARSLLVLDTHIDTPFRLSRDEADVTQRTADGHFDLVRAREGGLDAAFMSIYVSPRFQETGGAREHADQLIDRVELMARRAGSRARLATSTRDVRENFSAGRFSLLLGMENGAPLGHDVHMLQHFHDRGIRYITLTHGKDNQICDSSYDDRHTWQGLSPFGSVVVLEMNRLGIMVDVSHVSDDTFEQVLEISQAPVIASHSSCRHFTPGWERNLSDAMIRSLAENGGVVQVNFGSVFLNDVIRKRSDENSAAVNGYAEKNGLPRNSDEYRSYRRTYFEKHPIGRATIKDVADHIDHVVRLVGVDHVGFGSDFDGVDALPEGLEDVSRFPRLLAELLERGYSDKDIEKMASGNLLRVLGEVEAISTRLRSVEP